MLEKISLNTQIQTFKAQTLLFEKDQALKILYMLTSGVVYLTGRHTSQFLHYLSIHPEIEKIMN